jgi:uncharacterized protein (TIRG00374 family)
MSHRETDKNCNIPQEGRQRRWLRQGILTLIGLAMFCGVVYLGGRDVLAQVARALPFPLFMGFVTTSGAFAIAATRWTYITNQLIDRQDLTYLDSFSFLMAGVLLGQVTSTGISAMLVRSTALNRLRHMPFIGSIGSVAIDKFLDFCYMIMFAIPAVLFFTHGITLTQALICSGLVFAISTIFLVTMNQRLISPLVNLIQWVTRCLDRASWFSQRGMGVIISFADQIERFKDVMTPCALLVICLYSLARQILLVSSLYCISLAIEVNISPGVLFLGAPFAQLSQLLAFTPGALGILEASWYGVFAFSGIERNDTLAFLVARRACAFLFAVVLTSLSYLALMVRKIVQQRK